MRSLMGAGALVLGLFGASAASASAAMPSTRDVRSARLVVSALTRFDRAALDRRVQMTAAAKALVANAQANCPAVLPASLANGTPAQQGVAFDLTFESAADLSLATLHPLDHPGLALAHSLDSAHFTKRSLTRGLRDSAKAQRVLLGLSASDLCADLKAAAAGGFASDPPGTTRFLAKLLGSGVVSAPGVPDILKAVKPDMVTTRDRTALKRLRDLSARYEKFVGKLTASWGGKLGNVITAPAPGGTGTGAFPIHPTPQAARMTNAFAGL